MDLDGFAFGTVVFVRESVTIDLLPLRTNSTLSCHAQGIELVPNVQGRLQPNKQKIA